MTDDESKQTTDDNEVGDASRVRYSCSQEAGATPRGASDDTTQSLELYFLYEIETTLGTTNVELRRLQVAYAFNLASKLLPCAGGADTAIESDSADSPFVISAVDSAKQDEFLEIGLCNDEDSDTATSSNSLCHIVDGSLSILYSSISGTNASTTKIESYVSSKVAAKLKNVFEDSSELLSGLQPNILGVSLILPITTTPPDHLLSNAIGRKIVSPTTIASFCTGLFASILLLYFTTKRYHSRDNNIEDRNKRSDGENSTPRRSLRRSGIRSPRGGLMYVDLDDNVLPDSSGSTMESSFQPTAFNFEPVLAATTSTESESMSLSVEPSSAVTISSLQSPTSSDSSCPFHDLPEDDSRSYGSVDLDCSIVGDGDLSTIYEEPTFSFSTSF